MDSVNNQRILIGKVTQANITDSIWYRENYNEESASSEALKNINKFSKEVTVEVFFGTWCDDSRYWVPSFIGLIDKTELADQVSLVAVPRSKKTAETAKLKEIIERVPTFVFWRDGEEIGRIVEAPEVSLVMDMIEILKH
jgi:thiol-disulfide isomerase/thioredoxin